MVRSAFSLLLLLAGCGTADDSAFTGFSDGSPEELAEAETRALDTLFSADGAATLAGVEGVEILRVKVDEESYAHTHVRQLVDGVPVWGGEAIVHLRPDGALFTVTDDLVAGAKVDTTPEYTADEAIDLAVEQLAGGWQAQTDDPAADLWVIRQDGVDHLAWRVQLRELLGDSLDAMPVLFVDAHTGEQVWGYDNLQTATCTGNTAHYGSVSFDCYTDGTSYYLEDTTDLIGAYSYNNTTTTLYYVSDSSPTYTSTATQYTSAIEAHYGLQATWSFFNTTYGRNGIDGAGGPAYITSHGYNFISALTSYSTNYVNAYWDGSKLTFGDGDGVNAGPLTTLDVLGHEYSHGVTENESNLTYSGESGHLNESISDIFGAMVERSVLGETADTWLIGEDAWTPGTAGDALRYMNDPADDGYSYDYYSSSIGSVDVHYGSGVPNLVFYLMSEGGTHPRGKSTVTVTGIGADQAAQLWYTANASYMTSSTTFSGARTALLNAAASLYGTGTAQYAAVQDAWAAVGVGSSSTAPTCTTTAYSGSIARKGQSAYAPSSSGTAVTVSDQSVSLTGAGSDFDLYLDKASGRSWTTVASSATRSTSTESLSYSGSSGTYRVRVYARSGSGSYSVNWCK